MLTVASCWAETELVPPGPLLVALAFLGFLASCGAPTHGPHALPPEEPMHDAGAPSDAGPPADAGTVPDAVDAGTASDAGDPDALGDGGAVPDAGPLADAGTAPDAGPSADAGLSPIFEAVFSARPADDSRSLTVENRLVSLIDSALPGSSIRVAVFSFTRAPMSAALLRAAARGVDVRVVVDGDAPNISGSEIAALQIGLGASRVHICDSPGTACVGSGIMHHKTFLFSALADGRRQVVVQASHNPTAAQLTMHNNALIVHGDAALFAAYRQTFDDLERDVEIPNYYRIVDGDLGTRAYFFPRLGGGDTVVSILDNIACDSAARIRVAMAFFTDARLEVAQALAARANEGCDVRVVAGDDAIPVGGSVSNALTAAGVELTRYPPRGGGWSLHSKYLLIDARYSGSAARRGLVFTGSHNWTGPALTVNDETLLRVEDEGVFNAYLADWLHVRQSAVRP